MSAGTIGHIDTLSFLRGRTKNTIIANVLCYRWEGITPSHETEGIFFSPCVVTAAGQLNVSKPTLIEWGRELTREIQNARTIRLDELFETFTVAKTARVEAVGRGLADSRRGLGRRRGWRAMERSKGAFEAPFDSVVLRASDCLAANLADDSAGDSECSESHHRYRRRLRHAVGAYPDAVDVRQFADVAGELEVFMAGLRNDYSLKIGRMPLAAVCDGPVHLGKRLADLRIFGVAVNRYAGVWKPIPPGNAYEELLDGFGVRQVPHPFFHTLIEGEVNAEAVIAVVRADSTGDWGVERWRERECPRISHPGHTEAVIGVIRGSIGRVRIGYETVELGPCYAVSRVAGNLPPRWMIGRDRVIDYGPSRSCGERECYRAEKNQDSHILHIAPPEIVIVIPQ